MSLVRQTMSGPSKRQMAEEFLNRQLQLKNWMENVIGKKIPIDKEWNFQRTLQNGDIICHLMLKLKEGSVPHVHNQPTQFVKVKENIHFFTNAMEEFGVARHRQFRILDLQDSHNFFKVVECLEDIAHIAEQNGFEICLSSFSSEVGKWSEAELKRAEDSLMFVKLKPRSVVRTTKLRTSANVRKSMALANPALIGKRLQTVVDKRKTIVEKGIIALQAHVRGRIARRKFQRRITNQAYRKNIVDEILQTEEVYVKKLNLLLKHFYQPLKDAITNGKPILKQTELRIIFSDSIEVIVNYNTKFLQELTPRIKKWTSWQTIGDIFLDITSFMKVYTQYVKDYPKSVEMFDSLKSRQKFQQFLQDCREISELEKQDLQSFLILPIQRIPRYTLLLKELVKHTWPDHRDYNSLKSAFEKMEEVATYINERKREADNLNKIWEIEKKLTGKFDVLADPGRRFVREDNFTVLLADQEQPKDCIFFLFNDRLIVARSPGSGTINTLKRNLGKNSMKVKKALDVSSVSVKDDEGATAFSLVDSYEAPIMKVFTTYKDEKNGWIADFTKVKEDLLKQKNRTREIAMARSKEKVQEAKDALMAQYVSLKKTSERKRAVTQPAIPTTGDPNRPRSSTQSIEELEKEEASEKEKKVEKESNEEEEESDQQKRSSLTKNFKKLSLKKNFSDIFKKDKAKGKVSSEEFTPSLKKTSTSPNDKQEAPKKENEVDSVAGEENVPQWAHLLESTIDPLQLSNSTLSESKDRKTLQMKSEPSSKNPSQIKENSNTTKKSISEAKLESESKTPPTLKNPPPVPSAPKPPIPEWARIKSKNFGPAPSSLDEPTTTPSSQIIST